MVTINLRDFYPWYTHDEFVEVNEEVAAELIADKRKEKTHKRKKRRNKVYSLNVEDGTEEQASIANHNNNPESILSRMDVHCRLCCAINSLPEIQGQRINAYFLLSKSIQEIAYTEGVSESSVKESIERGIKAIKKVF